MYPFGAIAWLIAGLLAGLYMTLVALFAGACCYLAKTIDCKKHALTSKGAGLQLGFANGVAPISSYATTHNAPPPRHPCRALGNDPIPAPLAHRYSTASAGRRATTPDPCQ